jgi:hypothetical protein
LSHSLQSAAAPHPVDSRGEWMNSSSIFFCIFIAVVVIFFASLLKRIDPLELLVAGGKRKTCKIGAVIRMKRFYHSKEIGIWFLLFCSAEPQKDLVIRIDSLLLCVHIEQTTGIFFFPLFYYLVGFWLG